LLLGFSVPGCFRNHARPGGAGAMQHNDDRQRTLSAIAGRDINRICARMAVDNQRMGGQPGCVGRPRSQRYQQGG